METVLGILGLLLACIIVMVMGMFVYVGWKAVGLFNAIIKNMQR